MPAAYDTTDALNATIKQQFTSLEQQLTISGTANTSNALAPGKYRLCSTDECYILQGASTVTLASSATGILFPAAFPDEMTVTSTAVDGYVTVIGTSGTLCISPK